MADIKVRADLESTRYRRGIAQMKEATSGLGRRVQQVGQLFHGTFAGNLLLNTKTAFIAAIGLMARRAIMFGSKMKDLSDQTGLTVTQLERLDQLAQRSGYTLEQVVRVIDRMKSAQAQATQGNEKLQRAFETLGISINLLGALSPQQIFERIGQALVASNFGLKEQAAALDIVGERGAKLKEIYRGVAGGIDNLDKKLIEFTDRQAVAMDALTNGFVRLGKGAVSALGMIASGWQEIFALAGEGLGFGNFITDADERRQAQRREEDRQASLKALDDMRERRRKDAEEKAAAEAEERKKRLAEERKIAEQLNDIRKRNAAQFETSSIRRMGGFAGDVVSPELQELRRQLNIQYQISEHLRKIEENTREGEGLGL
jgi:uncharacterized protein YkuJ